MKNLGSTYNRFKLLFSGKKKEAEQVTNVAAGRWRGYLSFGNVEIINREDGSCSLYALASLRQTAIPSIKGEGNYEVVNGVYRCVIVRDDDSVLLETTSLSPDCMSGIATSTKGGIFPFELEKCI